jgi:putative ABC transport system permease protein
MFNQLFRYTLRSFKRQRAYIIINILGLSTGIACSLLIAIFVINEAYYDRYNTKKERIFRVILDGKIGGQDITQASTAAVIGPTMMQEFPEIEDFLRINGWGPTIVNYNNQTFLEEHMVEADSSFFNFFSIKLLKGNPNNLLNAPHKAVLSESTAKKIFGSENPIDKTLKIGSDPIRFTISGIMADIPGNSHFEANIITSVMTYTESSSNPSWLSNHLSTYLLLKPNSDHKALEKKFPGFVQKYLGSEIQQYLGLSLNDFFAQGNRYGYFLQNLTDIHLDPSIQQQFKEASDPKYLTIFGSIAILIILIAAVNFMNLSTAQSSKRAKEVGIKKIGGSTNAMLVFQFLFESFILTFISLLLALVFIIVSLPWFNNLLGESLALNLFTGWYTMPVLVIFSLVVGFLAGGYPAFYLSSFNPYEVLKGSMKNSMSNGWFRRILVVFQFSVSILLIVGTLIMYRQIKYMLNKDAGFNKEQLLVINRARALGSQVASFKNAVREIPGVKNIASSTAVPGRNNNNIGYMMEGSNEESFLIQTNWIDYDFLEVYGMTLASGRTFNELFSTDREACLVNEATVKNFGIADIEKTRFMQPADSGRMNYLPVIGVVKNFNFESLHSPVGPYIFRYKNDDFLWGYLTVKISTKDYPETITELGNVWKQFTSDDELQYS